MRLKTCHENWQQMTSTEKGHHCRKCNRVVLDFTQARQAELETALRMATNSRVCGRFDASQLAPLPRLRPKLRQFLVALVLIYAMGLSAGEAIAQVKYAPPNNKAATNPLSAPFADSQQPDATHPPMVLGIYVEQMPSFIGGTAQLQKFIQENRRWPVEAGNIEGRVFVLFTIDAQGKIINPRIAKSLHPALDREALRLVGLLEGQFVPGRQAGQPVPVNFTLPINFSQETVATPKTKRKHN
ncbi:TonB family protein [Hymenobacter sp. DG25B]|uniref:TonB family protein n=1 Tax=Hymenobacter sp. DG25B TaxID=1385664 RepID=UPI0018CD9AB3|nr:TonB family protein [Hymenobacter sp. DG25B]